MITASVMKELNINSFRNKFDALSERTEGNVDIISKTKTDYSFPIEQFTIGFAVPCRLDKLIWWWNHGIYSRRYTVKISTIRELKKY